MLDDMVYGWRLEVWRRGGGRARREEGRRVWTGSGMRAGKRTELGVNVESQGVGQYASIKRDCCRRGSRLGVSPVPYKERSQPFFVFILGTLGIMDVTWVCLIPGSNYSRPETLSWQNECLEMELQCLRVEFVEGKAGVVVLVLSFCFVL